jgi:hypothetical protein
MCAETTQATQQHKLLKSMNEPPSKVTTHKQKQVLACTTTGKKIRNEETAPTLSKQSEIESKTCTIQNMCSHFVVSMLELQQRKHTQLGGWLRLVQHGMLNVLLSRTGWPQDGRILLKLEMRW